MTTETLKSALLDSGWVFCLPSHSNERNREHFQLINHVMVGALNSDCHIPTCHAALVDAKGDIHSGFFIWNPVPSWIERIKSVDPHVLLTPKELYIQGKPLLYPDPSTLEVSSLFTSVKILNSTLELDSAIPSPPISSFYRDESWRNCFFLIPHPLPDPDTLWEEVQKLANIRGIELESPLWRKLGNEARSGDFSASTERVRKLIIDVCTKYCPTAAQFGFLYNDAEGNRV